MKEIHVQVLKLLVEKLRYVKINIKMKARDEFRAFIVFMSLRCYNLCVIYNLKIYVVL